MEKRSSVRIAKDRLKTLVVADRIQCMPASYEKINRELYKTLSKYMEIAADEFQVTYTRTHIHIKYTGEDK